MDRSSHGKGDRKLFGMLRSGGKSKTRSVQKAITAVPGIAESIPATGTDPAVTSSTCHIAEVDQTPDAAPQAIETGEETSLSSLLKISPSPLPAAVLSPPSTAAAGLGVSGDRERTEKRYKDAVDQLQRSIKLPRKNWEAFAIPDFKDFPDVTNPIPQLQVDIEKTMNARAASIRDPGFWSTTKRVTERIFTAITPLAKNVLFVAKEGSNVCPDFVSIF